MLRNTKDFRGLFMPRYDYACFKCKAIYDMAVTLDDLDTEIKCPECGEKLIRMISAPPFAFK